MKPHLRTKFRRRVQRRSGGRAETLRLISRMGLPPATVRNIMESLYCP